MMNIKAKIKHLPVYLLFAVVVATVIYGTHLRSKLLNNHNFTTGKVTQCKYFVKSGGEVSVTFEYKISGKLICGSKRTAEITESDCKAYFIERSFPIIYHPEEQSLSLMLFSPEDFESIKVAFPDSLQWVKKYLRE